MRYEMTDEEYARNIKAPVWPDRPGSPWPPGSIVAYKDYNENVHVNPPIWRRSGIFRTSHRPARGLPFLYYYAGIPGVSRQSMTDEEVRLWVRMEGVVVVNAELLPPDALAVASEPASR